jgi:hypothetical protein
MIARFGLTVGLCMTFALGCGGGGGTSNGSGGTNGSSGGTTGSAAGSNGSNGDGTGGTATGSGGDNGGTGGSTSSSSGAAVGEACPNGNGDCASSLCWNDGEKAAYCTIACSFGTDECKKYGSGWGCSEISGNGTTVYRCLK